MTYRACALYRDVIDTWILQKINYALSRSLGVLCHRTFTHNNHYCDQYSKRTSIKFVARPIRNLHIVGSSAPKRPYMEPQVFLAVVTLINSCLYLFIKLFIYCRWTIILWSDVPAERENVFRFWPSLPLSRLLYLSKLSSGTSTYYERHIFNWKKDCSIQCVTYGIATQY